MAQVAAGDETAFGALCRRLQPPSIGLAARILGDRGDAEDVVQTALVRLWTDAHRFDPARGSVEGWFRRIVVNLCLDRRRRVRIAQPLDAACDLAASEPDPFEASAANARARRVDAAMAALVPRQRAAIALFHGDGASMAEIAALLDITPKAVEGLLARARKDLGQLLHLDRPEPVGVR